MEKANVIAEGVFVPDALRNAIDKLVLDVVELIDQVNPMLEDREEADDIIEVFVPLLDALERDLEETYAERKKALKIMPVKVKKSE